MEPITIPLHLIIPALMSLSGFIFLLISRKNFQKKNPAFHKSGAIFCFTLTLLLGNAVGHDIYYQCDLNRYDLDQDGIFSQAEITHGQALAAERLNSVNERNPPFLNSFLVSATLSISIHLKSPEQLKCTKY